MRSIMRRALPVAALVIVACLVGGCTRGEDVPRLDEPQVLNVNLVAEPQSLDPQRATDSASLTVLRSIYSGLLRMGPDLELVPDTAREVPTVENGGISADGLTYTFRLREGLLWSDGTPLVAQAFVDGARRLFEPGSANYYVDFYRVIASVGADGTDANAALRQARTAGAEGAALLALEQAVADGLRVEAPDDRTVVYHLSHPSPVFLMLASLWPLYPVRQDVIAAHGDAWTEPATHVSNGAFKLQAWNHNQDIQLVRNEHWHGEAVPLEVVNLDMIADSAVALLAYQNGELDTLILGPAQLVQVRGDAALREQFRSYASLATVGVYFNLRRPGLQDVRVRQALAGAFDREEYAEVVREGALLPAYGWVPPGMPGHDETVGQQYRDAVAASQQLLADAGYPGGAGLTVTVLAADQSVAVLTAEWLKAQWERNLGITVAIDVRETASAVAARNAGEFDVVSGGWGADYPDPQNWLPLFRTGGRLNAVGFSNAEFDALIDQAGVELDNEERIELYLQAQRIFIDEAPFTPLYYGRRNVLVQPWVQGMVTSSMEHQVPGDLYFDRVWIDGRQ